MSDQPAALSSIIIVGNDVHAWSIAARLAVGFRGQAVSITVVGTAPTHSLPVLSFGTSVHAFHRSLGVRELDLVKHLNGAYCYGMRYQNWQASQSDAVYTFSPCGEMLERVHFHHYLNRLRLQGDDIDFESYSLAARAAKQNRFTHPQPDTPYQKIDYAMQFDGAMYAQFLRSFALDNGVKHTLGSVVQVRRDAADATIRSLTLDNRTQLSADFYFDAQGELEHLMDGDSEESFDDWSRWFPCNRELTLLRATDASTPVLETQAAIAAGWWRSAVLAGLETRQVVFNTQWCATRQAVDAVVGQDEGESPFDVVAERDLKLGVRRHFWRNNYVAVGRAAGDITSLYFNEFHFTHTAVERWLSLCPAADSNAMLADEYNRKTRSEYESARDIHALRLQTLADTETPLSQHLASISWPESLQHRRRLFESTGQVAFYESDLLEKHQWVSLFISHGVWPQRFDPLTRGLSDQVIRDKLSAWAQAVENAVAKMPLHDDLLRAIRHS